MTKRKVNALAIVWYWQVVNGVVLFGHNGAYSHSVIYLSYSNAISYLCDPEPQEKRCRSFVTVRQCVQAFVETR